MHVVATAGHVDHGKSTLVRALTGMEPDRWAEERRRGMTIDLGYAWTALPSGERVAFVDVPGHQRFIANMLAGLGPAPAVLFVVAADEGWSRQSDEHLAAVNALQLEHGVLAVTRSDLADPATAMADARQRLARSSLGAVPAVAVSGVTGAGLDELRAALDNLVASLPAPEQHARVRLWVDRAFTVRGSGTVVTGTLGVGTLRTGQDLELHGELVGVRGLQTLGERRPEVRAVARVAVNLRGTSREQVGRGDALLSPGAWHLTSLLDVRLSLPPAELPAELVLHIGTAAVAVRVRPLGGDSARLTLQHQLPLQAGDRAVLRDPGRQSVAAGVLVLDADPPPLIRRGAAASRARALQSATGAVSAAAELARRGVATRDRLRALGADPDEAAAYRSAGPWLVHEDQWRQWLAVLPATLERWREQHPLEAGMPTAALARALRLPAAELVPALLADAGRRTEAGRVVVAEHRSLGAAEPAVAQLERRLSAAPFAAPERHELAALRLGRRELAAAEQAGRLLRLPDEIVLLPDAPQRAVTLLAALPQPFSTSQARQALTTTRRVVIPLLERLDELGLTERVDAMSRRVRS